MRVNGLDHVNISTTDIASSVRYYTELFNLQARNVPAAIAPDQAQWLYDNAGHAIIHLVKRDETSRSTGPLHHVALSCTGKDDMLARLRARGAEFSVHEASANFTQIFTRDPHGVLLELNFSTTD
ncbi:MAG: VOC family protein [Spongiibacteraceae bacterium]